jgi:hypothetical protein
MLQRIRNLRLVVRVAWLAWWEGWHDARMQRALQWGFRKEAEHSAMKLLKIRAELYRSTGLPSVFD